MEHPTNIIADSPNAMEIINNLKDKAADTLSASLGSAKLKSFDISSSGNFPYVWEDPRNLSFNQKTYEWISGSLKPKTSPAQFAPGTNFTNLYLQALTNISWSLSTAEQATLNQATQNTTQQQAAVLNAWKSSFGSLPAGTNPIDEIASTIATTWANPATDLESIRNSINLGNLLNKVPAAGQPVMPVFVNWLNAYGASLALQNQVTMNNAYLRKAVAALQSPSVTNGGITLNDGNIVPAYIVNPQVSDIENAMSPANAKSNVTDLEMTVSQSSQSEFSVSIKGGASFKIPVMEFITFGVGGSANYFHEEIVKSGNDTTVHMTFPGTNLVTFGPRPFRQSGESQSWFWMDPVRDAIKNGFPAKDVSGFKFATQPGITDWSATGPFGYLAGVAIANYPTIKITVKSSNFQKIATDFKQGVNTSVSFLGIELASASEATHSAKVDVNESDSTVTITLEPPKSLVAGNAVDSVGWILGAITEYPAS